MNFFVVVLVVAVVAHVHQHDNHELDAPVLQADISSDDSNRNARVTQPASQQNTRPSGLAEKNADSSYSHTCIHDDVQRNTRQVDVFIDYSGSGASTPPSNGKRQTVADSWAPIRIKIIDTFDNDDQTCTASGKSVRSKGALYSCRSDDVLTTAKKNWLRQTLLPRAKAILEAALQVRPVPAGQLKVAIDACGTDGGVDPGDTRNGVSDTDLVIFVTARPITTDGVLAYASACVNDMTTRRSIAGHLNYSPASLKTDTKLDGQLGTTLHEMSHILGFSSGKFQTFYDPLANNTVYDGTSTDADGKQYISSTRVKKFVEQHFACATAVGGEIEGDGGGGTSGSHWEKRVFQNEYMTGSSSSDPVFSNLTLALFEDSGWYKLGTNLSRVAAGIETRFIWGHHRGCAFITKKCNSKDSDAGGGWPTAASWPGYFCTDTLATSCAFDMRGKARCGIASYNNIPPEDQYFPSNPKQGGLSQLADFCPFYSTTDYCSEAKAGSNLESFGPNSRCFVNTLAEVSSINSNNAIVQQLNSEVNAITQQMGCYETFCSTVNGTVSPTLKLNVGGLTYNCPAGTNIKIEGKSGSIKCPPQAQIDAVCSGVPIDNDFPSVLSISPTAGKPKEKVTIRGTGFKKGIKVMIDAPVLTVTFNSDTELVVVVASQDSFKDPRHLAALSALTEKKSVIVENPDGRKAALLDAFELTIDFNIDALTGFIDLMVRNPLNTALVGIALLLGCLCCIYCCCSSSGGGNNAKSRRRDYGGFYF